MRFNECSARGFYRPFRADSIILRVNPGLKPWAISSHAFSILEARNPTGTWAILNSRVRRSPTRQSAPHSLPTPSEAVARHANPTAD